MVTLGIAVLLAAALAGAPLIAVLMGAAMLSFLASGIDLAAVPIEVYRIVDTPLLVALPLFTYAGYVLAESNTSQRLVAVVESFFGWLPSGLAIVSFTACALFTALTGASGVTIVALGALLLPALVQAGFGERFSLGLVTSSGSLGLLLAPSVPLILYGVIAQQIDVGPSFTIVDLFKAGIMPLLIMLACLMGWTLWTQRDAPVQRSKGIEGARIRAALVAARWELPLPVVVLGGIYSGYFAISEAAAVTAVYVTIAQTLLYRDIRPRDLPAVAVKAMVMVGGILLILGVALAFTNFLVDAEVPQRLFDFMQARIESPIAFLALLNILLLALGALLDIFAALVIMVPLILPVAVGYGIDPVHLGIVFLANMQIGYFTPPVGMNLFIASYRFKKPVLTLYAACWPFMVVLLVALLLITYVPWFSLALVR
ncbi:MAG: TRAP transporter large permease subunit [Gammaproteobacteria bacterium]|nr:TRAP transporter large permease subunit [Gammaproteobacteria bacterium]MYK81387.1 TRAP transporter large permease subunit [Gammaproteobacteria bacterium]